MYENLWNQALNFQEKDAYAIIIPPIGSEIELKIGKGELCKMPR